MDGRVRESNGKTTRFEAYGKNPVTGKQLIKVKHVSVKEFEANPNMIWDYDVMMHGTWDANLWNAINDNGVEVIRRYIDAGKGVLTGHDTLGYLMGKAYGIGRLASKFNLYIGRTPGMTNTSNLDSDKIWGYFGDKVKITKKGFLTQFPWNLGPVRNSVEYTINTHKL